MDPNSCLYFEHAQHTAAFVVGAHCRGMTPDERGALLDAIVRALADAWTTGHAEGEREGSGNHGQR